MNEERLRSLLREAPIPEAADAERRGLRIVEAAYADRRPERRPVLPRAVLALATAALLALLLLSPAGAAVRGWIGDVFSAGVRDARPGLTRIPGGGRLLVSSPAGPWVVQSDGSRRLLGDYRAATWSPHGLYLAVAAGRTLTAVEPGGTPHWSLSAPGRVRDPRWSPSGFEVAYRSGQTLRAVGADGEGDRLLDDGVSPLAPAWSPSGLPQIAYVDITGHLVVRGSQDGRRLAEAEALPRTAILEWGAGGPDGGGTLLEASPLAVRLRSVRTEKLAGSLSLGRPREASLPGAGRIVDAALSPDGREIAVLRILGGRRGPHSEVDLTPSGGGGERRLYRAPGRLAEIAWSPGSSRLLVSWPDADQWLFLPAGGRGRIEAVAEVAGEFAPGERRPRGFPRVDGWCCAPGRR